MIKVVVRTTSPQKIVLKVSDSSQANTYFTDRTKTVNGEQELFVRMPLSPNTAILSIYNEKNGNQPKGQDNSFEVVKIEKEDLDITLPQTKMDTMSVRNFVKFAQKFAYNAGWISAPKDYVSTVGGYKIEYLPFIINSKGEKMATPARISTKNGRIQVSQEAFRNMTIPMRMAILLHEYSHYYLNTDITNETEADLNGLTIYLGLGYPIREAYAAFTETFIGYPSAQNKQRYDIINRFIKDYIAEYNIKDVYANE
jgi:Zn-dependent protease with chaperone function